MSTKHTPGPWRPDLHNTTESAGRTYGWVRAGNELVPLAGVTLGVEGMPQDEGRANARLIAAAPELLAALQMVPLSTEWSCMEWDTQDAVLAAIAKATAATVVETVSPAQSEGVA